MMHPMGSIAPAQTVIPSGHSGSRTGFSIRHTEVRHRAAHRVDVTGAVEHTRSAVGGWHRWWAVEGTRVSFSNTGLRHHAAHGVEGSGTVDHALSTVHGWHMWTEEWALVSLSNTDLRHRASHRVGVTRTASHTFSTVSGWERWAIMGRHSQGSGDESEEQERHLEAFSARQFCLPGSPWLEFIPQCHM